MLSSIALVILGFIIGILSGLFGVGGGFLLTPMLNIVFNIPYNIAVGSSLCQMIGTATAASLKYGNYGNIDYRLATFSLIGAIGGIEIGARLLMFLKNSGTIIIHQHSVSRMYIWVNLTYVFLLSSVGICMFIESRKAKKRTSKEEIIETKLTRRINRIKIRPNISLPISGIKSISIWIMVILGFVVGMLSGFLGVGGGFIITPSLIYLIGISTNIAVGTSLFQIVFASGYGTLTHFFKGNVNFTLVICVLCGSLIGAQLGAKLNKSLRGAYVRYYFSWVIFVAIGMILVKLLVNLGYISI